jgi:hypothetical protein
MAGAYSLDLRKRVIASIETGASCPRGSVSLCGERVDGGICGAAGSTREPWRQSRWAARPTRGSRMRTLLSCWRWWRCLTLQARLPEERGVSVAIGSIRRLL